MRNRIARLNADGSLDVTFDPNADAAIHTLIMQPDGRLLVGGDFDTIGGQVRHHIARLNSDGSVDAAFAPNANSNVYALALQSDGKLVAGGGFTTIDGQNRFFLARLSTPQSALQSLDLFDYAAGNSITWTRSGAGPQVALPPQLLFSVTGETYASLGAMFPVSGGWRHTGFIPPRDQNFYLRVRAQINSSENNGSGGVIESTREFHLSGASSDGLFADDFD
jgi:uncharacterized delta-60 repeat protein